MTHILICAIIKKTVEYAEFCFSDLTRRNRQNPLTQKVMVINMLKGIPKIISPELLKIIAEMGHGDELCISDGNFPGASTAQRLVRADGHGVPELLSAILELYPLDTYAPPVCIMEKVPGDTVEVPVWNIFADIVAQHSKVTIERIERYAFYERAKKCYAVVQTGESALYANIIIKKGVIK